MICRLLRPGIRHSVLLSSTQSIQQSLPLANVMGAVNETIQHPYSMPDGLPLERSQEQFLIPLSEECLDEVDQRAGRAMVERGMLFHELQNRLHSAKAIWLLRPSLRQYRYPLRIV